VEPLGHEAVGEIVDLADDVVGLALGDLIVVPRHVSCGM
jgi:threonine dehydrogenase-like Zn-dependent dehydrogenase